MTVHALGGLLRLLAWQASPEVSDAAMPRLNRPKLSIDIASANQLPNQLRRDAVFYVHGSNSASIEGVCRFRALLCMEDIDRTPWFHRSGGLLSGERGYTIDACYKGQPVAKGVSLYSSSHAARCIDYCRMGLVKGRYPVLYGLDDKVQLSEAYLDKGFDHPLTHGSVSIDRIRGIYVPTSRVHEAQSQLAHYGMANLAALVHGASLLD